MYKIAKADHVVLRLDETINQLSSTTSDCYLYKVPERLRKQNATAYEPEMLAIGPYYHGRQNLQLMEETKLRYLQQLLGRRNERSTDRYIAAMRYLQERARRCYAEPVHMKENDFVVMLLLDSCFIVELFRKFTMTRLRDRQDCLFQMDWIHHCIWRDILLFENQIPFFVVVQFFNMTKVSDPNDDIISLAKQYYYCTRQYYYYSVSPGLERLFRLPSFEVSTSNAKHLLGLIHDITSSSFAKVTEERNFRNKQTKRWEFIRCATELHEAGIRLKKAKHETPLFDINFINGELRIPHVTIYEHSECLFRNMIAHEQILQDGSPKYVTDYLTFLFCLFKSSKDVSLLRRYGIVKNMLGDDEAVSAVFSKASACVFLSRDKFCYSQVFNDINAHCRRRQNIWTAKLRRNYFNSPWAVISFLAAVILLILTLAQTVFSVLSYFYCNK